MSVPTRAMAEEICARCMGFATVTYEPAKAVRITSKGDRVYDAGFRFNIELIDLA